MPRRNSDIRVQIYESEYRAIVAEARRLPQTETGGDLYGTFTHGSNPIICLASGPGPVVRHEQTHFEQDSRFTTFWESRLTRDFGLQYIGSWHSHHFLGLQEPSSGDVGAAQIYAQQHNRQTTLEIIVNHQLMGSMGRRDEQKFSTTLRPYFYSDAQNARTERFILASFVSLAGVSPFRQQLDRNDLASFNLISWQQAAGFTLPVVQAPQNASSPVADDNNDVVVPDALGIALRSIENEVQEFNIQESNTAYLLSITLRYKGYILALPIQKSPELQIMQVNLIDQARDINENISARLHNIRGIHFSINANNRNVLLKIVRAIPSIHQEVVEEKRATMKAELSNAKQREEEVLALRRKLQEQNTISQQLDEQRQNAQQELNKLRIETQSQLDSRTAEIQQLMVQLSIAQQRLADQRNSVQNMQAFREEIDNQRRLTEQERIEAQQQFEGLQGQITLLKARIQEANEEREKHQQIEAQLNEKQQQLEAQKGRAQELERRLQEYELKFAAQDQLQVRFEDAQKQIAAQQHEATKLQIFLDSTYKLLVSLKTKSERRRQLWFPNRNKDGPDELVEQKKERRERIVTAAILAIILAIILIFMFDRLRIFNVIK